MFLRFSFRQDLRSHLLPTSCSMPVVEYSQHEPPPRRNSLLQRAGKLELVRHMSSVPAAAAVTDICAAAPTLHLRASTNSSWASILSHIIARSRTAITRTLTATLLFCHAIAEPDTSCALQCGTFSPWPLSSPSLYLKHTERNGSSTTWTATIQKRMT